MTIRIYPDRDGDEDEDEDQSEDQSKDEKSDRGNRDGADGNRRCR